uniref:Uncharacterized protein n=1 Tax=Tricholoma terreum TaxID=76328 RepID=A0A6C0W522_9AGAR|nr:hypothetical protein [Tricholoma terreum]QIC20220.1 hypothetical protein [Tricholoma terreum]
MLILIYNLGLFIEMLFNSFTPIYTKFYLEGFSLSDFTCNMMNNDDNTNNNPGNNNPIINVPNQNRGIFDYSLLTISTLIIYLSDNIAILGIRRPFTVLASETIVNASMVILDLTSSAEMANYWIDEYNHYIRTGTLRLVEEPGGPIPSIYLDPNPFARVSETNNLPLPAIEPNNNFIPLDLLPLNFDFIRGFLTPVPHSIPLETLINVHTLLHLSLLLIVVILILLILYFYLNLFILLNRDYLLNNISNKYLLLYVKFVLFRTRIDILILGILTLALIFFIFYILHYLIIHPIILN